MNECVCTFPIPPADYNDNVNHSGVGIPTLYIFMHSCSWARESRIVYEPFWIFFIGIVTIEPNEKHAVNLNNMPVRHARKSNSLQSNCWAKAIEKHFNCNYMQLRSCVSHLIEAYLRFVRLMNDVQLIQFRLFPFAITKIVLHNRSKWLNGNEQRMDKLH